MWLSSCHFQSKYRTLVRGKVTRLITKTLLIQRHEMITWIGDQCVTPLYNSVYGHTVCPEELTRLKSDHPDFIHSFLI